jgi:fatty acid-binding protein DegV
MASLLDLSVILELPGGELVPMRHARSASAAEKEEKDG